MSGGNSASGSALASCDNSKEKPLANQKFNFKQEQVDDSSFFGGIINKLALAYQAENNPHVANGNEKENDKPQPKQMFYQAQPAATSSSSEHNTGSKPSSSSYSDR